MPASGKWKSSDRIHRVVSRMHTCRTIVRYCLAYVPDSMKMPSARPVSLLLLAVALMASAGTVWAQGRGNQGRDQDRGGRDHERGNDHQGLSDSVRRVERRTG